MKTNALRCMAFALGLTGAADTIAQYQYPYQQQPSLYQQPSGGLVGGGQGSAYAVPLHPSLQQPQQVARQVAPQQTPQAQTGLYQPQYVAARPMGPQRIAQSGDQLLNGNGAMGHDGMVHGQPTQVMPAPAPMPMAQPAPMVHGNPGCSTCNNGGSGYVPPAPMAYSSPYQEAVSGPTWSGESCGPAPMIMDAPVQLSPWFAGAGVMFMDVEDDCDLRLVFDVGAPSQTRLSSGDAGIGSTTGANFTFGRYFCCGRFAFIANYWFLNPSSSEASIEVPGGSDYRAPYPMWGTNRAYIDLDGDNAEDFVAVGDPANENVYDMLDRAEHYRIRRDMNFNNIELSIVGFGIGGAGRMGVAGCGGGCGLGGGCGYGDCGGCNPCGNACNPCNPCCRPVFGCAGGPCGPIVPGCGCRLRTTFGHGVRWFRMDDDFEFAASISDSHYGGTNDDIYYNLNVRNDLVGYQTLGRIDYCLGRCFSVYAGGKAGMYVNSIDYSSRLGGGDDVAQVGSYYPSMLNDPILISATDRTLSFLGELDLGMNYSITPCWSINAGYRLLGVAGVATAVGQIAPEVALLNENGHICSNQSLVLHGAYVGAAYNW